MSPVGPMFTAAVDKTGKSSKNPKIHSLVDEILNDSSECHQKAPIDPESSKIEVPTPQIFPKTVVPMVENNENPVEINATYVPNLRVEDFTGNTQSRTKEAEHEEDDSIDDIKPKGEDMEMEIEEFTLPDSIEGVRDRFDKLYVEFMRHNKHENTNELSLPPNMPC